MKKISILLPTYNRLNKLTELVEYLKAEGVFDNEYIEVIISNNGSCDGTDIFLNELNEANLCIYSQESNIGILENFRFLINKAIGEYIWIMGDNDYYMSGLINYVLRVLDENRECTHIFLNYGAVGEAKKITHTKVYHGDSGIYKNGLDMFYNVAADSTLGALMFISANIYRLNEVRKAHKLIDQAGEEENFALPLGYSLFCSKGENICIGDVYVYDEMITPSTWSDSKIQVYCRDIIAMYDCIADSFPNSKELKSFLVRHLPTKFPEYKYFVKGRKLKKDNYAMKFFYKNCPRKLLTDLLEIPIYVIFLFVKKNIWKGENI